MKIVNFTRVNKQVTILMLASMLIISSAFLHAQDTSFNLDEEFEKTAQLIVMLRAGGDQSPEIGAGIVFGREKDRLLIATANHILRDAPRTSNIKVQFRNMPQDKYVSAKLLKHGEEESMDLAIISVEGLQQQGIDACSLPFDQLGKVDKVKRGNIVYPIGNPNGVPWAIPVAEDRVSRIDSNEIVFQSSFISKGHSGGGLMDRRGSLVGMTVADAPPFGRAINLGTILRIVKKWGYTVQLDTLLPGKRTPLHIAVIKSDMAAIKFHLSDCGDPNAVDFHNASPLHYAAFYGGLEALSALLKAGADPNILDGDGDPPLQWAIDKECFECVKLLVSAGTKINSQNKKGETVLQIAIDSGLQKIALFLIEAGANVNLQDEDGSSPLYTAVKRQQPQIVEALLKAGAKVNVTNHRWSEETPLCLAIRDDQKEIINLLLKAGAKDYQSVYVAAEHKNFEIIKLFAAHHFNMTYIDNSTKAQY